MCVYKYLHAWVGAICVNDAWVYLN